MRGFLIKRILLAVPTIFGVVTLVFFLIHIVPGDPVALMLGDYATKQELTQMRHELNLDKPITEQYMLYMDNLLHGNIGTSLYYKKPVLTIVMQRFGYTAMLALFAMILALFISIPLGILSAYKQGTWADKIIASTSILGISLPNFWIAIILIIIFSLKLNLLPVAGAQSPLSIILPGVTLAIGMSAITIRMVRANMITAIRNESFTANLAKGISIRRTLFIHALKATLIPVITLVGMQFGLLLSGAIITETVFSWPGMGRLLVDSVMTRDYPLLNGTVLVIALIYVIVNLITDVLYYIVEPRMRKTI